MKYLNLAIVAVCCAERLAKMKSRNSNNINVDIDDDGGSLLTAFGRLGCAAGERFSLD